MDDIDKWYADKCGVTYSDGDTSYGIPQPYWYDTKKGKKHLGKWTIQDPRCRELCRVKFNISTAPGIEDERTVWHARPVMLGMYVWIVKESLEDAEIACFVAIYEQESE